MPRFFYKGGFYNTPAEIKQLQFDQLRSHLYPRNPYLAAQSLEPGQPPVAYLPQRMMFSRFKTPPMQAAWLENARSALEAGGSANARISVMQEAAHMPPMLPFDEAPAALGLDHLPEAPIDPNLDEVPLSRGVLPYNRVQLHASELAALVREQRENIASGHRGAQDRRDLAMAEVGNQISAVDAIVSGSNVPWFERGVE